MTKERIEPHKVTSPIQLLAAWLVSLIVLDSAFLSAAGIIKSPEWLPIVLVLAAIINVPIFLVCMFFLQTKFRPEMQADRFYADYLKEQNKVDNLSDQLRSFMDDAGLKMVDIASGQSIDKNTQQQIKSIVNELKNAVNTLKSEQVNDAKVDPTALRALAQGLLAGRNWIAAAKVLEEYAIYCPDDVDANYSRGVAFANSRNGRESDLSSLRAYNDAIAFAPDDLNDDTRARLFTYRGAMFKRLNRLKEAEADLLLAQSIAVSDYVLNDIKYNLAGVYALRGERKKMLEIVRQLRTHPKFLLAIQLHLNDYFARYADDYEFLDAIKIT